MFIIVYVMPAIKKKS